MRIDGYLAAFEPFGGRNRNRAWEVARRVARSPGVELARLPVDFARLESALAPLVAEASRFLLLLGESPAHEVAIERVALNRLHAVGPDNAGSAPRGVEVVPGAALALPVPADGDRLLEVISGCGVPAHLSFHAGTFACNAALYHALHAAGDRLNIAFLHLPNRYRGQGTSLTYLVKGVEAALEMLGAAARPRSGPRKLNRGISG